MPYSRPSVCVITLSPSPYQVELFDAVSALDEIHLHVVYLYTHDPLRMWRIAPPAHSITLLDRTDTTAARLIDRMGNDDLVVVNYFKHPFVRQLLRSSETRVRPWCFWGERPRVHRLQLLGRLNRIWLLRQLHRSRAAIWGIGRMAVDGYREEFGAHRQYVNLPYYSDLTRFQTPSRDRDGGRVILFSGSLIERKGVDLVARAFARVAAEQPAVRLRVMGSGHLEKSLRRAVRSCADRVEFLGFRNWKDLPAEYARADILCVPSRYDGWGLVVPEGLAAGLPVISTTQTGAAVEFVQNGRNGWIVPPDEEEPLHRAMREAALTDDASLAAMSEAARVSVTGHTLQAGARKFVDAARSAIHGW